MRASFVISQPIRWFFFLEKKFLFFNSVDDPLTIHNNNSYIPIHHVPYSLISETSLKKPPDFFFRVSAGYLRLRTCSIFTRVLMSNKQRSSSSGIIGFIVAVSLTMRRVSGRSRFRGFQSVDDKPLALIYEATRWRVPRVGETWRG